MNIDDIFEQQLEKELAIAKEGTFLLRVKKQIYKILKLKKYDIEPFIVFKQRSFESISEYLPFHIDAENVSLRFSEIFRLKTDNVEKLLRKLFDLRANHDNDSAGVVFKLQTGKKSSKLYILHTCEAIPLSRGFYFIVSPKNRNLSRSYVNDKYANTGRFDILVRIEPLDLVLQHV